MKYILVTGGVISGIGKGIISSSIGTILRSHGYRVTSIKVFYKNIRGSVIKAIIEFRLIHTSISMQAHFHPMNMEKYSFLTMAGKGFLRFLIVSLMINYY